MPGPLVEQFQLFPRSLAKNTPPRKSNTAWQVEKVNSCFPKLTIGNQNFAVYERALQSYLRARVAVYKVMRFPCSGPMNHAGIMEGGEEGWEGGGRGEEEGGGEGRMGGGVEVGRRRGGVVGGGVFA